MVEINFITVILYIFFYHPLTNYKKINIYYPPLYTDTHTHISQIVDIHFSDANNKNQTQSFVNKQIHIPA